MKLRSTIFALTICIAALGCANEPAEEPVETGTDPAVSETAVTHQLRGVIVDRDAMANTLKVDHEAIGDWMGAMTMSFPVRGADVQDLPENGQTITGTIHVDGSEFWLSDVSAADSDDTAPPAEPMETEPAENEE